jgi:predicted nucleic acid-binding protein
VTAYLVDTNLPSELTKPVPHPDVAEFLIRAGREQVYASVVTIGEI